MIDPVGSLLVRLARVGLLLHPSDLRARYGDEVVEAARRRYEELRERGRGGAIRFALRAFLDVARSGVSERWKRRKDKGVAMGAGEWWTDVRVAARSLRRAPGFTLASALVLALGIGANAAVFSAMRATLLSPPPFPNADRLVFLDLTDSSTTRPGVPRAFLWSYPGYRALAGMKDVPIESSAAYASRSVTFAGSGDAEYVPGEFVSPDYLRVLGLDPSLGRDFTESDAAAGADLVVMLGYGLWKERYGADREVIGRSLILNGRSVTVVGVGPPGFEGLSGQARFWVPVRTGANLLGVHFLVDGAQAHWLRVVARMRPGVSATTMNRLMRPVGRRVEETYPDSDPSVARGGMAESMASALVNPQARRALVILGSAALLLLLVACANLAGLLATRASDRSREAAVRVALGAGRWRVARAFLAEALLLALAGGALAIGVAAYGVRGLAALWPRQFLDASWNVRAMPVGSVGVDWSVLAFAGGVAVVVGLAFGVAPALAAGKADPARRLNGASISGRGSHRRFGVRGLLVSGEIALALILLVGAGLLLRSLSALQHVDRGYRPGNLVAFEYSIPRGSPLAHDEAAFTERYLERLSALPDVESAALACQPPVSGRHCMITTVRRAGAHRWSQGSRPPIGVSYVSDGYFRTLGVPVLSGRTFDSEDQADSRAVVVLSASAVRRLFPEGHPLGKPVAMGTGLTADEGETAEVIGVVGDVLYDRPERGVMAEAYISHRQDEGSSTIIMRTRGEPLGAIPGARAVLAQLAPDVPIYRVRTVQDLEASVSADTRVLGILLVTFAALALLLACTGVWAVVALAVARRTREIGLRIALGAEPSRVLGLVVGRGVALAVMGLLAGGLGAWLATRLLRSVLFDVQPTDPIAFTAAAALLFGVACVAAWLPARRATRVQPMEALRVE